MRPIAGSILILAAVQFHQSPLASGPLGRCFLWLIVAAGAWYLVTDLLGERRRYIDAFIRRIWDWVLSGGSFLIKGTLLGALLGLLASFTLFGPSRIASVVAMPGAFIGLVLGVVLDALAHRHQHRQPAPKSETAVEAENPFADDQPRSLVESHGWDLSLGASHPVADWPRDSNPLER